MKDKIVLSLCTCKRLDAFTQTINSLGKHLKDKEIISLIIHYDDSSSLEDRKKMRELLGEIFPHCFIVNKHFEREDISTPIRHGYIMSIWSSDIKEIGANYVFHLEDDYNFIEDFYLGDAIHLLKTTPQALAVGVNWPDKASDQNPYKIEYKGEFYKWIFDPTKQEREILFDDIVEEKFINSRYPEMGGGYFQKYCNWYGIGNFGIYDVAKTSTIDNWIRVEEDFEHLLGRRAYQAGYEGWQYKNRISYHLYPHGASHNNSAYTLNESKR